MDGVLSVDDYLKAKGRVLSVDEYLASHPQVYSYDQLNQIVNERKKKEEAEDKSSALTALGGLIDQFGLGFLKTGTFGIAQTNPALSGRFEPQGTAEGVAQAIGSFAGLVNPYGGPGKVGGMIGRAIGEGVSGAATGLGAGANLAKWLGYGTSHVGGMAATGMVENLQEPSEDVWKKAAQWSAMGAVFGGTALAKVPSKPVLSWVLRQFGGRALLAATGGYSPDQFSKENLPHAVWQEALNTWFLSRGITPEEVLTGKFKDPRIKKEQDDIVDALDEIDMENIPGNPIKPSNVMDVGTTVMRGDRLGVVIKDEVSRKEVEWDNGSVTFEIPDDLVIIREVPRPPVTTKRELYIPPTERATGIEEYDELLKKTPEEGHYRLVYMSPDEYLRRRANMHPKSPQTPESMEAMARKSFKPELEDLKDKIKRGVPLDYSILDYVKKEFEGRTRAVAYKDLGIDMMPVMEIYGDTPPPMPDYGYEMPPFPEKNTPINRTPGAAVTSVPGEPGTTGGPEGFSIPSKTFLKARATKIDVNKIDIDNTKVDEGAYSDAQKKIRTAIESEAEAKKTGKDALSVYYKKAPILVLYYDPTTERYRPTNNSYAKAYKSMVVDRLAHNENPHMEVNAVVMNGPEQSAKLTRPMDLAKRFLGVDAITSKVIDLAKRVDVAIMGPKGKSTTGEMKRVYIRNNGDESVPTGGEIEWFFDRNYGPKSEAAFYPQIVSNELEGKVYYKDRLVRSVAQNEKLLKMDEEITKLSRQIEREPDNQELRELQQATLKEMETYKEQFDVVNPNAPKDPKTGNNIYTYDGVVYDMGRQKTRAWRSLKALKDLQYEPIPNSLVKAWEKRIAAQKMGVDSMDIVFRAIFNRELSRNKSYKPTLKDAASVEEVLSQIESAPRGAKMGILTRRFMDNNGELYNTPLEGEHKKLQWEREIYQESKRERKLDEFYKEFGAGNVLKHMIAFSLPGRWEDFRFRMMALTDMLKVPFYRVYERANEHRQQLDIWLKPKENLFNEFKDLSEADQLAIMEHYVDRYEGIRDPKKLSPLQAACVEAIDNTMREARSLVFKYRFKKWYDQVWLPRQTLLARQMDMPTEDFARLMKNLNRELPRVFKSGKDPVIDKDLSELAVIYEAYKNGGTPKEIAENKEAFEQAANFLVETKGLGLIEEDAYLPQIFRGRRGETIKKGDLLQSVVTMGQGHTLEKGALHLPKSGDVDIEDYNYRELFGNKPLANILSNYFRQIGNLEFLYDDITALDSMVSMFEPAFSDAKPRAFGKMGESPKRYTAMDYMKYYVMRLKGTPVKLDEIGAAFKGVQVPFFRSLTVRPALILRNIPQRWVTPAKSFVLDARYYGPKYAFKNLPNDFREWFENRAVDELVPMENQYLDLHSQSWFTKAPVVRNVWKTAEWIGRFYALSDYHNRRWVYTKTAFKAMDLLKAYQEKRIDLATLQRKLLFDKMKNEETREISSAIQEGDFKEAAFLVARWNAENSQWNYSRWKKSPAEMTGPGEAYTNLLTWSKSMTQQVIHSVQQMEDGYKRMRMLPDGEAKKRAMRQMFDGSAQVVGVMLAGYVANKVLETIMINHGSRYKAYGLDMFTWQLGGVTQEVLDTFSTNIADVVGSIDGTAAERRSAMQNAVKMVDNTLIRQLIPFAKTTLSMLESVTGRDFIAPLADGWKMLEYGYPKGIKYVDRSFLEQMTHAIFAVDPSKTEDMRRYAWQKLQDYQHLYNTTDLPGLKEYYGVNLAKYQYYNDLFQRMTPAESFETEQRNKAEKRAKAGIDRWNNYLYEQQQKAYKMRRR